MKVLNKRHQKKEHKEGRSGENGGKIERKLSEVNTMAPSRRQNELKSKFKMAVSDVISIGRRRGRL